MLPTDIPKSDTEFVRFTRLSFHGRGLVDVRVWRTDPRDNAEQPTVAGLVLPGDMPEGAKPLLDALVLLLVEFAVAPTGDEWVQLAQRIRGQGGPTQ